MKKELRYGLTTGTCVAVGTKAALMGLVGNHAEFFSVRNPQGQELSMSIADRGILLGGAWAELIKDGGDDPDVTHGARIRVEVRPGGSGIRFVGGPGVGIVTKPGLQIPVGEPAINPVPRQMAIWAAEDVLGKNPDVEITVCVENGEALGKKTLNPQLGIVGGISILGTTGIVRPMSEEAFKRSLLPQLDVIKATGYDFVILVPGRMGEEAAVRMGFPREATAQMSNFVGTLLRGVAERQFKRALFLGHVGKLAKIAAGSFNTHNKIADGRREIIAAIAALQGINLALIEQLLEANTTEEMMERLLPTGKLHSIMDAVAVRASKRAEEHVFGELKMGTILTTLDGKIIGLDHSARQIGEELTCNLTYL